MSSKRRVVVTGLGLLSPAGCNVNEAWNRVLTGKSCIKKLEDARCLSLPSRIAGKIALGSNVGELNISEHISANKMRTMSVSACYALIAARQALSNAKWPNAGLTSSLEETGVAVGTGMIDFDDIFEGDKMLKKSYNSLTPYFIPKILTNMGASQISIEYGFQGPNHSVSTACATGANSIGDSFNLIRNNQANVMVCGGTDACINPLSIAGFCRLRALSTNFNDNPEKASRPFDKNRDGFVIAEGAAILVLEELNHALSRGVKIYAEICGYGLSGDATHVTTPHESGKGAVLAMERAVKDAGILLEDVNYINAHATSTPIGDAIELNAIKNLFKNHSRKLIVSSTKGIHGHLLGAAGSLETLITVLACSDAVLPPNSNLENPSEECLGLNCITRKENWNVPQQQRIALKNSFGFGGTNACLCISAFNE